MRPSFVRFTLAALLLSCASLPAIAGERAGVVVVVPGASAAPDDAGLGRFILCLRIIDLSPAQKTDIEAILEAAKPVLQADADAIQAARAKLYADIESGADPCLIGQDVLAVRAARQTRRTEAVSVENQILAQLTDDQRKKLLGCVEAPGPTAAGAVTADGSE